MTLEEAIAEVTAAYNDLGPLNTFSPPQGAVGVIAKAVASGDLIPRTDADLTVALAYQRAAEVAREGYMIVAPEGVGQRQSLDSYRAQISTNILALAPDDALAEVQALRAERDEMVAEVHGHIKMWGDALRRAEAAEAEVARLREAL